MSRQQNPFIFIYIVVFASILTRVSPVEAQQLNLDSLKQVWEDETEADTSRLQALQKIAWDIYVFTEPDTAFYYAQVQFDFAEERRQNKFTALALHTQGTVFRIRGEYETALEYHLRSLKISEDMKDKKGLSRSYNSIGIAYEMQGFYDKALDYYFNSLKVSEEIGNKRGTAYTLGNIGIVSQVRGDLARAIDYYSRGLKIHEEIGNTQGIAIALNNIGLIYEILGEYDKALDYYMQCLKIAEEKGIKQEIATILNNIGVIYEVQGDLEKSFAYHERSLDVCEEAGYKFGMANALIGMGIIYQLQNNYTEALDYCTRGLKIAEELNVKKNMAYALNNIAQIHIKQGYYSKSLNYSNRALTTAKEVGAISQIRTAANRMYRAYQQLGNYKGSIEMYELYIDMRDSIENIEGQKEIVRLEFKYKYEKKKLADSIEFAKKQELDALLYQTQLENEANQRYLLAGSFLLSLIFVGIYLRVRFIKNKTERESLHQEIKLLKVEGLIKTAANGSLKEQFILDKEKIEATINNSLNPSDWNILKALFDNPAIGNNELADLVSLSVAGVRSSLQKMYRYFGIDKPANQRMLLVMEATKISNSPPGK